MLRASVKSDLYQGSFLRTSATRPPNSRPVNWSSSSEPWSTSFFNLKASSSSSSTCSRYPSSSSCCLCLSLMALLWASLASRLGVFLGGSSLVLGSQEAGVRTVISPRLVLRPRRMPALVVAL